MLIRRIVKKLLPGVSWQNPAVNAVLLALDPLDYIVRYTRNLTHLPRYSIRVRSNGLTRQFGGHNFNYYGRFFSSMLQQYASMDKDSYVLEIGCGCGRTAIALASILEDEKYVGMDIERISLTACKNNPLLTEKKFKFDFIDVQNKEYNPDGKYMAADYTFPYSDHTFDVIFLVSVFTHMLSNDVRHYISEIGRMLKPGGICMMTAFLMDHGTQSHGGLSFPMKTDEHYYHDQALPEVAVGYELKFFVSEFEKHGLIRIHEPVWERWRNNSRINSSSVFPQDILFFKAVSDAAKNRSNETRR